MAASDRGESTKRAPARATSSAKRKPKPQRPAPAPLSPSIAPSDPDGVESFIARDRQREHRRSRALRMPLPSEPTKIAEGNTLAERRIISSALDRLMLRHCDDQDSLEAAQISREVIGLCLAFLAPLSREPTVPLDRIKQAHANLVGARWGARSYDFALVAALVDEAARRFNALEPADREQFVAAFLERLVAAEDLSPDNRARFAKRSIQRFVDARDPDAVGVPHYSRFAKLFTVEGRKRLVEWLGRWSPTRARRRLTSARIAAEILVATGAHLDAAQIRRARTENKRSQLLDELTRDIGEDMRKHSIARA